MGGKKKGLLGEILRFNLVGIANTVLTYLIYSALVLGGTDYRAALAAEYVVGVAFSFAANKGFTFRNREPVTPAMVGRMIGSYALMLALNMGLLVLFVERVGLDRYAGQLAALAIVASLSFAAQKLVVFGRRPGQQDGRPNHGPPGDGDGHATPTADP